MFESAPLEAAHNEELGGLPKILLRSAYHRGELDLVGWDRDVLRVIEVKTRTTRDVKPAEAAVDRQN